MGFENIHNKKQCEIIELNKKIKPDIMFLDGAFGSGKTYISIPLFMNHVKQQKGQGVKYIMTGHTLGSLKRNVLDPMREIYGIDTTVSSEDNSFKLLGNKICCFGTDKENSYEAIRGVMEAYGSYSNEATLSKPSALKEMFARCRGEGSRAFMEMNPDGKTHYLYKTYIEPWEREGNTKEFVRVNSTMYDNDKSHGGYLPDEYIKRMETTFTGILYRKFVMGEWCSIEGQLYYTDQLQYYDDSVLDNPRWFMGTVVNGYMDPATGSHKKTGCFTSALAGALKDGTIYLTDAVVKKIMPNQINNAVGDLIRKRNYSVFAVEDNFSQDGYVVQPLKRDFPFVNIQGQSSREDKLSRLIGMHSIVMNKVKFPERWQYEKNSDGWLLLQQLCNITKERTDKADSDEMMLDAPDALEGLIRTFKNYGGSGKISVSDSRTDVREAQTW